MSNSIMKTVGWGKYISDFGTFSASRGITATRTGVGAVTVEFSEDKQYDDNELMCIITSFSQIAIPVYLSGSHPEYDRVKKIATFHFTGVPVDTDFYVEFRALIIT